MSTLYSTSINLGSSATFDVGTDANEIVQLDNNARLPAVDGSQLTNLPGSNVTGALVYRGVYDATANNPVLTGAVKGDFYKVSVAGSLAGVVLNINDHIVFNQNASSPITSAMFDVVDNTESTETLDTVTTNGAITTNNITTGQITVDGDVLPASNLSNSVGSESARFITTFSNLNGAVRFKAKNDQGAQITKGQVIYIKGISGDVPTVGLAQANSALTMPAFGFVAETANDQAECQIITFGNIEGLNTSSFSVGDTLYISSTSAGGIANTAPTSEANLIQNIGKVLRSHATEGIIKAGGAGRTNATPNLDQNKIFLGDANNQAVSTALSAVNLSSFNNDLGLATVATSGSYNDLSNTPSLATVATSGSYNDLSNKPSIPSALNDLSDVSTAGASNNQVLVHNGAVFANAQLDYSQVANTPSLATVATSGSYNDLSNTPTLGTASALDVGINANNVVQLNASAQLPVLDGSNLTNITGTDNTKLAIASNLSDLNNVATAKTNLGLATVASTGSYNDLSNTPSLATVATTGSYNDLSNTPTLGTASALDVGTNANNVVQLDGSARLPAVDGSQLTNLPSGATVLNDLSDVSTAGASNNQVLVHNGAVFANAQLDYSQVANTPSLATVATSGSYNDLSNTPTLGTASALDVGTNANNVVQLNGSAQLPAVDGSNLTNITGTDNTKLAIANNLSDLNNVATARTNLGLATVASTGSYNDLSNTPSLATVATSGSYNDLSNKPSIPSALNDLSDVSTAGASNNQVLVHNGAVFANAQLDYSQVANTPSLATVATTGSYNDLSNTPTLGTASALDVGTNANNVVQLNGSAQLPAVDGSLLTNLPSGGGLTYQARDTTTHSPLAPTTANYHYSINANSANFVINLGALTSYSEGDQFRIKLQAQTSTYNVTINANGSDTIDGQTNSSPLVLSVLYQAVTLVRGATEWEVI